MLEKDCKLLRVSRDADLEEIRQAFIKLTRRYPPEHFPEKFKQIKGAYDRLTLNWDSTKPLVKELVSHQEPESMAQYLLEEALQAAPPSASSNVPELDIHSLEPVLNTAANRQKLMGTIQKIKAQGLEYKQNEQE